MFRYAARCSEADYQEDSLRRQCTSYRRCSCAVPRRQTHAIDPRTNCKLLFWIYFHVPFLSHSWPGKRCQCNHSLHQQWGVRHANHCKHRLHVPIDHQSTRKNGPFPGDVSSQCRIRLRCLYSSTRQSVPWQSHQSVAESTISKMSFEAKNEVLPEVRVPHSQSQPPRMFVDV